EERAIPQYLLTNDSGMLRDQSDANRTPGAKIEVFPPLSVTLARLDGLPGQSDQPSSEACLPDCDCPGGTPSQSPGVPAAATGAAPASDAASRSRLPALFLGVNSKLLGQPVNILFAVDHEAPYDQIAPLRVDALIGNCFIPLISTDETRALGETGLLKMAFP